MVSFKRASGMRILGFVEPGVGNAGLFLCVPPERNAVSPESMGVP